MTCQLPQFSLVGKTAVVTGAASGIGEAAAQVFAAAGADVVLADIDIKRCEAVAAALRDKGANVNAINLDVSQESQWQRLEETLADWTGRWDVLMNNAGIYTSGTLESSTTAQLQRIHDVNVVSVFLGTRIAATAMKKGGAIWSWWLHHKPVLCGWPGWYAWA